MASVPPKHSHNVRNAILIGVGLLIAYGLVASERNQSEVTSSATQGCLWSDMIRRCASSAATGWSSDDETRFLNWVVGCEGGDRSSTCRPGPGHSRTVASCVVASIEREYPSADVFFFRIDQDERLNTLIAATLICEEFR